MSGAAKKKETKHEDPIAKWEDLNDRADRILNTLKIEHSKAYINAADAVLRDEEGKIDYDRLKDTKHQEAFVEKMLDHYITSAKQSLKLKDGKGGPSREDVLETDMLLNAVYKVTAGDLRRTIAKSKHKYTLDTHENIRDSLMKKAGEELGSSISSHLTDEHVGQLVKYAGAENLVDINKIRLQEAIALAYEKRNKGMVSPKDHEDALYAKKAEEHGKAKGGHHN